MTNKIFKIFRLFVLCSTSFIITHPVYAKEQASDALYAQCRAVILSNPIAYCGGKAPGVYERCIADTIERCKRYPNQYLPAK